MKYSIFKRLNPVRKSDEMFTTPKPVVENCMPRKDKPSIEHRTQIQLELQELRSLLLESKTLEAEFADLCENKESMSFKAVPMKTYR